VTLIGDDGLIRVTLSEERALTLNGTDTKSNILNSIQIVRIDVNTVT